MKNKLFHLLMVLFMVSCGGEKTSSLPGDAPKGITSSRVTVQSILANMDKGRYAEGEVLVKFKSGIMTTQSVRTHQTLGASLMRKFSSVPNLERVKLPAGLSVRDAVIKYMSDSHVEYAEPNYLRHISATVPNDKFFDQQWALHNTGQFANGTAGADIKAPEAWDISRGDGNIVIAVLDTGIDLNHVDLADNIWINPGETPNNGVDDDTNGKVDDLRGWDFTTCAAFDPANPLLCATPKAESNNPSDDNGHGTLVSGIIGARGNNGIGTSGVMWTVKIMALKMFNADGSGTTADEISAIDYAVMMKNRGTNIKAINASFGGTEFSTAEKDAVAAADAAGILFIAAAGNEQTDNDLAPEFPASYSNPIFGGLANVISVAATDQNDSRASFSGYGLNSVHVAAPGVYILGPIPTTVFPSGYDFESGTSMAVPHVTGLAGLLYSFYDGVNNTQFNHLQVRSTILRYVDVLPTLAGRIQTGGRINAFRALSSLLTPTNLTATAASSSEIILTWADNATGEDGYRIERKGPTDVDFVDIVPNSPLGPNTTTFTDSGLSPVTAYTYRVKTFSNIGDSFFSNAASATTLAPPPAPSSSEGGGGGGCSVGTRQNTLTASADFAVLLAPLLLPALLRRKRKSKE